MSLKKQLNDIPPLLKWSTVSTEYFGKSRTWMYQRMAGNEVNGKPAESSDAERLRLKDALHDIARRIDIVAENL